MIALIIMWGAAIGTIIAALTVYRYNTGKLEKNNKNISELYKKKKMRLRPVSQTGDEFKYRLRDYYIASSYNSCCGNGFFFDYVDYEPLKQVIKQGARALDFEIYSVDGNCVVAAGKNASVDVKGTFNSLPITSVFQTVYQYACKGNATCPNPSDPLFLNLRVKSHRPEIYNQIADALDSNFTNLLSKDDKKYAFEAQGENMGECPLTSFIGKVVIILDNKNNKYKNSRLEELVNFTSSTPFLKKLRNYEVVYTHDMDGLIEYNKKNISITMPDYSSENNNVPAGLHHRFGCQFVCMNYQNMDKNLDYYIDFFQDKGTAFVLKPKNMRYVKQYIPIPKRANPELSFKPRAIIMPQYQGWM
jgi:hypothetical protein